MEFYERSTYTGGDIPDLRKSVYLIKATRYVQFTDKATIEGLGKVIAKWLRGLGAVEIDPESLVDFHPNFDEGNSESYSLLAPAHEAPLEVGKNDFNRN